jgi:biopolymer transport protein TolR
MRVNRKPLAEINVVPYIDVMLVLLVIFMITAQLLSQGVNVELPHAAAKPLTQEKEPIIVSINANGQFFLNIATSPDQAIDDSQLKNEVAKQLEAAKGQGIQRGVFVKGDKHVAYDKVMQAMVLLQQAGAESVGLITQDLAPPAS